MAGDPRVLAQRLHACAQCYQALSRVAGPTVYVVKRGTPDPEAPEYGAGVRFFCSEECVSAWQVKRALQGLNPGAAVEVDALEYVGPRA